MKRFWVRVAVLGAIALGLQLAAGRPIDDQERPGSPVLEAAFAGKTDLIYFGDSVLDSVAVEDRRPETLPALVQERLPGRKLVSVSYLAFDLDMFDALTASVARRERHPSILIVPINLRSFSPRWDRSPQTQFASWKFRLRYGDFAADRLLRPLSTLKVYPLNPISQEESDATPVFRGDRQVGVLRDFLAPAARGDPDRWLNDLFVIQYLYALDAGHRKVSAMTSIADRCRKAGMTPVFYVTPVDVETGTRRLGSEFRERIASNVAVLRRALEARGLSLHDFSAELGAADFNWQGLGGPNEHLKESGRKRLAELVAGAIPSGAP